MEFGEFFIEIAFFFSFSILKNGSFFVKKEFLWRFGENFPLTSLKYDCYN